MSCCKEQIICHIIRQLNSNSACSSEIDIVIPAFWDLVCVEAGGNCNLHALLTKREAILFLLGCEAYSVDTAESHYSMSANAISDSRNDYQSQMQSTGSSNKFAIGTGNSKYNEKSSSHQTYDSLRKGRAKDKSDGDSFYRDDGRGFGFNKSEAFNTIDNIVTHANEREIKHSTFEDGARRDCNYEYSTNNTVGDAYNFVVVLASYTGSASEWRKYISTNALNTDRTEGTTRALQTERDFGLTTSRGTHRWENTFLADIEWTEKEYIIRFHNERFDSRRYSQAHSDGVGDSIDESKVRSHAATQSTMQATGDSEVNRTVSRVSNLSQFSINNSQRFSNLTNIYDQLTEQIARLRRRIRQTALPKIAVLACNCYGECCCMPQFRKRGAEVLHGLYNSRTTSCASCSSML